MSTAAHVRLAAFLSSPAPDPAWVTSDFVAAAAAERVHVLVAARLRSTGVAGDSPPVASLYADERRAAVEDVARTRELVKVVAALDAEGCRPIVFKGAALAQTHYGQPWWRLRLDTDLLIPEDRRDRAARVFARLGYQRPAFVSGRLVMYQEMFVRSEPGGLEHVFDLHWHVANRQVVADAVSHADLDARGVTVTMDRVAVRVPCPADALVLACVHRAAHHHDAPDLLWLYDIHLLAARLSDAEWRAVVAVARTGEVAALCDRGLRLACEHFGTSVPRDLWPLLATDGSESSAVFLRGDRRPVADLRSDLRALGWTGRVRLMRELFFPPSGYMHAAFGPGPLSWLYVRRALNGAVKWIRLQER